MTGKELGQESAYPTSRRYMTVGDNDMREFTSGITKREYIACRILSGLASNLTGAKPTAELPDGSKIPMSHDQAAVALTDALLDSLAKDL